MEKEKKEKIKKDKKPSRLLNIIKNKWLIKGTTTVALVAIIIVCYVLLNYGVSKINVENLDFTEKKLYSLSDETKTKMKELNKDVSIQLINLSDYSYVTEYANKYPAISKNISVEEIEDLSTRVDLQTKYNITETEGLIVVSSGEKEKTLSVSDLYTYDYSSGEQINKTEEAITNAIIEVTIEEKPQLYILSGKTYYPTEQALASVIDKLEDESNEVNYLDILTTGQVPEDCDCLIITTLQQDLNELERDKIIEYINNGGKIMMVTSQNMIEDETPNFDEVLSQYGIKLGFGVVFEQESSQMLQDSPNMVITDVQASFMDKLDMAIKMCGINAGKIEFEDDEKLEELGITYEAIASTSEKSFLRTDLATSSTSRVDKDSEEGSIIVGAYINKEISDDKNSQLIIYSNELFASNIQVPISAQYYTYAVDLYNNEDVMLNSISHLTERTDTISIRKTDETESYTVTDQEDVVIKTIIFVVPIFVIFIGIVVWIYRRRKV